jgi:protocatechuate 3,4-dioxygenase beta subunit
MQTTKLQLSHLIPRRQTLMAIAGLGSVPFYSRGAFAEELTRTARVEEGPFYPRKLPLDTDNDLLIVNDSITPAVGEVTEISGRLLDSGGSPIRNALIEIWQVDNTATYLEEENRGTRTGFDSNFQGFGRFLTGSTGEYLFRTIKPVPYRGRPAPHVHFKVKIKGQKPWTTQLFVKGHPGNAQDQIYRRVGDAKALATVTAEFAPVKESRIGELQAHFDIVMGTTAGG